MTQPTLQPKEGGHGDHWGCVFRSIDESALLDLIVDVARNDPQPDQFDGGRGMAAHSMEAPMRVCVFVKNRQIASAYPDALGGPVWAITVKELAPWANGVEGQIVGECHGATVAFFDTHFYANGDKYKVGETYNFYMSAFTYIVGRAPDAEVEADMGAKVSLKGARAYMSANLGATQAADVDDYWFHSPIESEVLLAELAGRRLWVYPITLAIPDDFEMSVPLYAAEHAMAPDMAGVQPEDDLEGYLWLQGYLSAED